MRVFVLYVILNAAIGRPDIEARTRETFPTLGECMDVGNAWLAQKRPSGDPARSFICRPEFKR